MTTTAMTILAAAPELKAPPLSPPPLSPPLHRYSVVIISLSVYKVLNI